MNSRFSKRLGAGVMVLLTAVCFIPAVAGAAASGDGRQDRGFGGKGCHRPALGLWRDPQMVQELNLTEDQVKQVRDADFTFREKRLALKAQLQGLRLEMEKAFSDNPIDDAAVLSTAEKISDVRGKLFLQAIESRLSVRKLLNADQIKKLRLHAMQQKGPGHKRFHRRQRMERLDDQGPREN